MKIRATMAGLMVVIALAACTSGTVGSAKPVENGYESSINYNNTVLATRVKVQNILTRKVGDLLQVSAELHNLWDINLDFEYKFRFYDKDGFEVAADGRPWTPVLLKGNETRSIQAVAPNPTAVSFKIYVND
jgi:uncharacterized protein YcfL